MKPKETQNNVLDIQDLTRDQKGGGPRPPTHDTIPPAIGNNSRLIDLDDIRDMVLNDSAKSGIELNRSGDQSAPPGTQDLSLSASVASKSFSKYVV